MDSLVSQKSKSALTPGRKVSSEGDVSKQVSHDLPRRSYGPAAMIGVALSVGACGLLVPHKGDAALAAEKADIESLASEPNMTPVLDPLSSSATIASPMTVNATPNASKPMVMASSQIHTVQEGESLSNIARAYGITAQQVAQLNQFPVTSVLRVGQTISLPIGTATADTVPVLAMTPPSSSVPVASRVRQDTAVVKLKEQQSRLKKSLAELRSEENPIIAALPTSQQQALPNYEAVSFSKHRVEVGETLTTIARSNGISPSELAVLNRISDPNTLFANQVLRVPQAKTMQANPQISAVQVKPSPVLFAGAKSSSSTIAFNSSINRASVPELPQSSWKPAASLAPAQRTDRATSLSVEPSVGNSTRVDKLMEEVRNLRQKYQPTQVAYAQRNYIVPTVSTANVVVPTVSMPTRSGSMKTERRTVNPEFQKRVETTPDVSIQSVTQNRLDRVIQAPTLPQQPRAVVSATAPRLIARASMGSSNYANPLVQTTALRMAAPQMPSIGTSDNYLPQGKGGGAMKGYIWPAQGLFTSGYGWRWGRMHKGIDVAGPVGTPIVASAPGVVSYSGYNDGGFGYLVEIDHADGSMTRYAHNSRLLVREGQQVAQGQQISEMGSTGFSTGPHLHFEIHSAQGTVNPMAYLPNDRG